MSLDLKAPEVAYVAEQTPVEVIVANNDDRDVRVSMLPFLEGSSEADRRFRDLPGSINGARVQDRARLKR